MARALKIFTVYLLIIFCLIAKCASQQSFRPCSLPGNINGIWFSRENGENVDTTITTTAVSNRGHCIEMLDEFHSNVTIVLESRTRSCFYCMRIFVRTLNVLQKIETTCINLPNGVQPSIKEVCKDLDPEQEVITLFAQNVKPKNCRSSIEGVWRFAYQRQDSFTGECRHPDANITACQTAGSQFFIINQQFYMNYRQCEGMSGTFDNSVEFACLGDWYIGKNHFFAVLNVRESRPEEKYRCFLRNRDDDNFATQSITAECNTLETPQIGPERLRLEAVKAEVVVPRCKLPDNFTGEWIDTEKFNAEVTINITHMEIKWRPDQSRVNHEILVCHERRGNRFVMARLGLRGCQRDYICYEFVPRHHSLIRFRKGAARISDDFHSVCSWAAFPNEVDWKYELMIMKEPNYVRCPVAGKFRFTQQGEIPFETRIRGGVTAAPRPGVYCRENISDFSVCDANQRVINIDANYCVSVDQHGLPVDLYSKPDFVMSCVGFFQENLKSYMITHDPYDAFTPFRCWVYQRADLNKILLSQSLGAFCHIKQDVVSYNYTEGAAVALYMQEYEREHDDCPVNFDDGSNPWAENGNTLLELNHGTLSASIIPTTITIGISSFVIYIF